MSLLTKLEMDQADEEPEGKRELVKERDAVGTEGSIIHVFMFSGRFLEMHMYMTSALSKNDMKAIGLQMALDLLAKKEKKDSITGLRTRTQPGRPDWAKVSKAILFYSIIPNIFDSQCLNVFSGFPENV